jgi:hypothetical protein
MPGFNGFKVCFGWQGRSCLANEALTKAQLAAKASDGKPESLRTKFYIKVMQTH